MWDGEERRTAPVSVGEVNRAVVIAVIVVVAVVFGVTAFVTSQRQQDLLEIACANAKGFRALTVAILEDARLTERTARDLGLPFRPVFIVIPRVPPEC